jgi:hypothetical protein
MLLPKVAIGDWRPEILRDVERGEYYHTFYPELKNTQNSKLKIQTGTTKTSGKKLFLNSC